MNSYNILTKKQKNAKKNIMKKPSIFQRKKYITVGRERIRSGEVLEDREQVVVLGSNLSGAQGVAESLDALLEEKGVPHQQAEVTRDVASIAKAIFGIDPDDPESIATKPMCVVLLGQMRQYDEHGRGMTIDTGRDKNLEGLTVRDSVRIMCDNHEIPMLFMNMDKTGEQDVRVVGSAVLQVVTSNE